MKGNYLDLPFSAAKSQQTKRQHEWNKLNYYECNHDQRTHFHWLNAVEGLNSIHPKEMVGKCVTENGISI